MIIDTYTELDKEMLKATPEALYIQSQNLQSVYNELPEKEFQFVAPEGSKGKPFVVKARTELEAKHIVSRNPARKLYILAS